MKRISYETAKLAAKAGYNEPNEVYYCLDQNNNPKIECIIPDEPGIQNSEALQQLPEKSLNAFNRILDSICEEEKNDSKDESR